MSKQKSGEMKNKILFLMLISLLFVLVGSAGVSAGVCPTGMVSYWTFDDADLGNDLGSDDGALWDDGLVSLWHLDEASGTLVDSKGSNDGTASGTPTYDQEGIFNTALDFDGVNDYVNVGNDSSLDITSAITLGAWIKLEDNANTIYEIIDKGDCESDGGYFTRILDSNAPDFGTAGTGKFNFGIINGNTYQNMNSESLVDDNVWHYVVGTFDGTTMKVYIDGIEENSGNPSFGSLTTNTLNVNIGRGSSGVCNERLFSGSIDEVGIWNRSLSASEIQELYSRGAPEDSQGINNGTLVGAVSATGKVGNSLSFDGVDDYVNVGNDASLNFTTEFTTASWIKVNDLSDYRRIISKFETPSLTWIVTTTPVGAIEFQLRPGITTRTSSLTLTTGNWYHIVTVYKSSLNQDIYINGTLSNGAINGAIPASLDADSSNVLIGSAVTSPYSMIGLIDEVAIFNRALNASEISDLYDLGVAGNGYCGAAAGFGNLTTYWITPTTDTNVQQNEFFQIQIGVNCTGGDCGDVNVTLDPYEVQKLIEEYKAKQNIENEAAVIEEAEEKNLIERIVIFIKGVFWG